MEVIELKSGTIREANLEDRGATAHYQSRAFEAMAGSNRYEKRKS